jgi:hypothetical protein
MAIDKDKDPRADWPEWARQHFPTPGDNAAIAAWQPIITTHALAMCVLCVATTRVEGCWAAYCNAVPGMCHRDEQDEVLRHGDKLREDIARALFPSFAGIPYGD